MRAAVVFLSTLAAVASAGPCRPKPTSSSATLPATTAVGITTSTTLSTQLPEPTELSSDLPDSITSTTVTLPSTTSAAEPSTSTTVAEPTTTAPAAPPPQATAGFCLKIANPVAGLAGQHLAFVSPNSNIILTNTNAAPYNNVPLFNLDFATGAVTLNNTAYAGWQLYAPPPFDSQVSRVLRVAQTPANPVLCQSPDGQYASGSVLKCSVAGMWNTGLKTYDAFWSSSSSGTATSQAWAIYLDGYTAAGRISYDIGMYFGQDCLL